MRVRIRRFGGFSYRPAVNLGIPSESSQTIGLVEFAGFYDGDVSNTPAQMGLAPSQTNHVSVYPISGGASACTPGDPGAGCGTSEVLLDIAAVMGIALGADVVVFEGPNGSDFASVIELAADVLSSRYGGGALSLSWSECEGEVSASDVNSIESMLSEDAILGVTLFAATGDSGSTCTAGSDTYPNAISFPSDAPSTIALAARCLALLPATPMRARAGGIPAVLA